MNNEHIDLFSGIGGFALAARWAGLKTVVFCENDPYCQKVLTKNFGAKVITHSKSNGLEVGGVARQTPPRQLDGRSKIPLTPDIFDFDGTKWKDRFLLTGGFPCQPYSVAGKRRGKEDDRALWPEMFRVIKEARPRWVLGENVYGFVKMELDDCISDLESEGYAVQPLIIPACATDAPHRRDRVWIVAHSSRYGRGGRCNGNARRKERTLQIKRPRTPEKRKDVADTRLLRQEECQKQATGIKHCVWLPEPDVGRVVARFPSILDETIRRFGYENWNNKKVFAEIDRFRGEILREMWHKYRKTEQTSLQAKYQNNKNSMYEMSCLRTYEKWKLGQRIKKNASLRNMWQEISTKGFPQAQDLFPKMLERIREIERNEKVASDRVSRLKALGNAIVPQVAYELIRMMLEVEERISLDG